MSVTVTKDDTEGCLVNEEEYLDLWNRVCALEEPCPELLTRGELLALRNAGELDMSCHYAIPKTGNGCLGDVVIMLEPTATDSLSDNVGIRTTHSGDAWTGRYSILNNTIDALEDDRGNKVYGDNQTEVNAFPWGNTGWVNVTVDHATVQTECDTAFRVDDTTFENASTTDIRGATGRIQNSTVSDGAILDLEGANNAQINTSTFDSRSRMYAERTTNLQVTYSNFESESYVLIRDRSDIRFIYSSFGSTSRIYFTGGDRLWVYYTEIKSYAHLRVASGTVQMYYSNLDSYGEFRNEAGAGTALLYGFNISSRGYVRNFNTNRIRTYYNTVESRGEVNFRDAADQILYYSTISSYGILTMSGTATIVYGQQLDSNARWTFSGGTHYRNRGSSYSRINTAFNTRSIYADSSFTQTLTAANTNTHRGFGSNTLV